MFAPKTSTNGKFTVKETATSMTIFNNEMGTKKEMIFNRDSISTIKYSAKGNIISRSSKKRTRRMPRL